MFYTIYSILLQYREGILGGLLVTLELCFLVWGVGLLLGIVLGILGAKYPNDIGKISQAGSFILSGVPILVLLFWLHYPLQEMLHIVINPFFTAAFALSLLNIFVIAEIIRNALVEFPDQYVIAAKVCGMSSKTIMKTIQVPIIFRQVIPNVLTAEVQVLHLTLFASLISVEEIFRVAQRINATIYKPIEIYTALAIFFLLVCLPLNGLAIYLKNKYTRNLSEK